MRRRASAVEEILRTEEFRRRAARAGARFFFKPSKNGEEMTGMDDEDLDVFFDVKEEAEGR